ncbi:MAG: flagellar hook-length control protein FliK, partial [Alphaproteobacteria bacterium]|nr:flagellar hook-length control protein FliK [Alphaproteobacteria bacterium]
DKEMLAREVTKETSPINNMMDKSDIILRSMPSKMKSQIQSDDGDRVMDEVPIVSIALKRDPVMNVPPFKKSGSDLAPKNESLHLDQTAEEYVKDLLKSDSEEVEPLLENTAKEINLNPVSSEHTESAEVNISKPSATQQIQQAILDAKEGVSPKESKTLTVVLNPEELGVVNVELTSDETGKLKAVLSVEKRETLEVLQHDLHKLKTVLKEIGIDESSISLQLSSNNEHGQQKQSEYVAWEERELMLTRSQQTSMKAVAEKATYPERQSVRRLDIKA